MSSNPSTEAIWTSLSADLRRFIRRRVSDDHAADDLLQETFVRVHRNIGTLHEADRLAAWVYRIARNVIHDHHRQATHPTVALADADPADDAEEHRSQLRCRCADWLDEMIRSLPDGYREAVQLSEIEGLPQQEVADRLGLSLSGAKSRIQRGRAMLKAVLEQCCHFEFDRRGNLMDYEPQPDRKVCRDCDEADVRPRGTGPAPPE
jgi:RNA polymerase sigma-70 factor, ECF subfamily